MNKSIFMLKINDENKEDYEIYNFGDSGDGKSWLLGDDTENWTNAFIGGNKMCPKDITVPRSLTNMERVTRPVEVIGRYAYYTCGHPSYAAETRTVLVTKQVKVIKSFGFGNMYNVETFRFEDGNTLETIEARGLHYIGFKTGQNDANKRGIFTLPSSITSVASDGIYACNLFNTIIYCGSLYLANSSDLEYVYSGTIEDTKVMVTNLYSANLIFNRTAYKSSDYEVIESCRTMGQIPCMEQDCDCSQLNKIISLMLIII